MSVFVVRLRPDGHSHPNLVGIYRVASPIELEEAVARDCSSQICEYALVQHGGMYGPDLEGASGAPLYTEAADTSLRSVNDLSEDWRELFLSENPLSWHCFGAGLRQPGAQPSSQAA